MSHQMIWTISYKMESDEAWANVRVIAGSASEALVRAEVLVGSNAVFVLAMVRYDGTIWIDADYVPEVTP